MADSLNRAVVVDPLATAWPGIVACHASGKLMMIDIASCSNTLTMMCTVHAERRRALLPCTVMLITERCCV